ncbi:MAG: O-antigen ligase family protein [Marinilabiliaceae bacterium]|nr:O-antigen ligase family protein [Marinilabiliaceae bacterium]
MMIKLQRISLYIFFFSMNFEVWDPFQTNGYFSVSKLAGIIYFLVSIPAIIKFKTNDQFKPILKSILLFFSLLLFVNAIHADSTTDTIVNYTILQNIILFWILINHEQSEPLILEKGLLYFALGSATLALLYFNGIGIELSEGRVSIFGDNQNAIGQRMCFSIIIVSMVVMQNRLQLNKARFLLLLLIPMMLSLLVATGSRLAILSFALVFITGLVLVKTRDYYLKVVVFTVGIISFVFIWQFLMQNDLLRTRLLMSLQEGHLSERDVIWSNLLPLIENNPIFGVGQSGYSAFCNSNYGRYVSPHSVILELLCFTGTIGLLIYFFFLYQIFRKGYLTYKSNGLLLPILLIINIVGLLLVSHILELKIGWSILAYIAASSITMEKESGVETIYQSIIESCGSDPGDISNGLSSNRKI